MEQFNDDQKKDKVNKVNSLPTNKQTKKKQR